MCASFKTRLFGSGSGLTKKKPVLLDLTDIKKKKRVIQGFKNPWRLKREDWLDLKHWVFLVLQAESQINILLLRLLHAKPKSDWTKHYIYTFTLVGWTMAMRFKRD